MPLLFYFPLIVWMGMMEIAQTRCAFPSGSRRERRRKLKGSRRRVRHFADCDLRQQPLHVFLTA
jgi:hypothetical protein